MAVEAFELLSNRDNGSTPTATITSTTISRASTTSTCGSSRRRMRLQPPVVRSGAAVGVSVVSTRPAMIVRCPLELEIDEALGVRREHDHPDERGGVEHGPQIPGGALNRAPAGAR